MARPRKNQVQQVCVLHEEAEIMSAEIRLLFDIMPHTVRDTPTHSYLHYSTHDRVWADVLLFVVGYRIGRKHGRGQVSSRGRRAA